MLQTRRSRPSLFSASWLSPASIARTIVLLLLLLVGWSTVPAAAWARTETAPTVQQTPAQSIQPYLDRVIQQITEFRLSNGMKFIVLERHQAPVISFLTYADVGGADEPDGKTGVAHFLEHLAFKGTTRIGTVDYKAEAPLLDKLDQLAAQIKAATGARTEGKTGHAQGRICPGGSSGCKASEAKRARAHC
jgi:hypothetical protein